MPETTTNNDNFVRQDRKDMDSPVNSKSSSNASLTNTYRKSYPSCLDINSISSKSNNNLRKDEQKSRKSFCWSASNMKSQYELTQAGLEEYSRFYSEQNIPFNHQRQSSYAQSEGYHSYVSSTDSSSTPFVDRLRHVNNWAQEFASNSNTNFSSNQASRDDIAMTNEISSESNICSRSISSTETIKWLGSMSDVSVTSQTTNSSSQTASAQLIAHSSKVRTPQRHHSESILYLNDEQPKPRNNHALLSCLQQQSFERPSRSNSRLFPISTYVELPVNTSVDQKTLNNQNWLSVSQRICELEKQQRQQSMEDTNSKYTFLDPSKTHRIYNPTLKAFQKKAIQSYFQRQQQTSQSNRSSISNINDLTDDSLGENSFHLNKTPSIGTEKLIFENETLPNTPNSKILKGVKKVEPPPTPPRNRSIPLRRTSSASEYSSVREESRTKQKMSNDLFGPIVVGTPISVDEWVRPPARPPKNPNLLRKPLRTENHRSPSPPPPPADVCTEETDMSNQDEPLPPPPDEILRLATKINSTSRRNSFAGKSNLVQRIPLSPPTLPIRPHFVTACKVLCKDSTKRMSPSLNYISQEVTQSQTVQAQRVMISKLKSIEPLTTAVPSETNFEKIVESNDRLPVRKRSHNSRAVSQEKLLVNKQVLIVSPSVKPRFIGNSESDNIKSRLHATSPHIRQMRSKNLSEVDHKGINKIRDNQLDIDTSQLLPSKCNLPDLLPSNVKLCNQQHSISLAQQTHCLDRNMRHIESSNSEFNVFKEMFCDIEKDTEIFDENLPETLDQEFETVFCANNIQSDDKIFNHAKKECWSDKIVCEKLVEQNIHTENLIAPPTQETACQTDKNSVPIILKIENTTLNLTGLNRWGSMSEKYLEDTNLDIISRELRNQLSPSDKLHGILVPKKQKTSSDYISNIFNIKINPRPIKKEIVESPIEALTASLPILLISESKKQLMAYKREVKLTSGDPNDLTKKKEELMVRLRKKLVVLSDEQTILDEESISNEQLGSTVAINVSMKNSPADTSKCRSYVDDIGYITMLLLSISGRLASIENVLNKSEDADPEVKTLEAKRDKLIEQMEEAKHLKKDIDRRGINVFRILKKSLTCEEFEDFEYFVNMKAKLIIDSREISEKIKLGEEQLVALTETLVQSEC